jgi:hypothetical protein
VLPEPLPGTVLIARGSSDHAATTGRYLLRVGALGFAVARWDQPSQVGHRPSVGGHQVRGIGGAQLAACRRRSS